MRPEEKQRTKIGDAALVRDLCIVIKNGTKCGACAEHCPTGAVRMVVGLSELPEPVFTSSICIGCGACHHACPVKPQKAITVSGLPVHEVAQKPSDSLFDIPSPPAAIDDSGLFPF
jgi:ferredoxin